MSYKPTISVIMPVKNCGEWLQPAVDSILGQTFEDFELLLIDDHSYDGSIEVLPDDPRLKIIRHPGSGIVDSLNLGLIKAKGEFVARMDGDDVAFPDRFQYQIDFARSHPSVGIISGMIDIFCDTGEIQGGNKAYQDWLNRMQSHEDIVQELFVESPFVHPSVLIRKSVFKETGLYRDLSWPEDYDLWLRAWKAGVKFAKIPELVLMWREHDERLTRIDKRYAVKEFIKAKAWMLSETLLVNRPAIICGTGKLAVKLCDVLTALGVNVIAFVDVAPEKIGKTRRELPIISYEEMLEKRGNALVLGALGARGAGEKLRQVLNASRLIEGTDFILAG